MERSWYRFCLHEQRILAPLTEDRAAEMRAHGVALEPAAAPEDLVERLCVTSQRSIDQRFGRQICQDARLVLQWLTMDRHAL